MLERSFIFLPGVGPKTERSLWSGGLLCWDDFLAAHPDELPGRIRGRYPSHASTLERAAEHLARLDLRPFTRWLSGGESWRLLDDVAEDLLFLDIETTGLSARYGRTTVVGLHRPGRGTRTLVRGRDLTRDAVQEAVGAAAALVTFNGKRFDVPFLREDLGVRVRIPHVDLLYPLRKLGLGGGLKRVERKLGLVRDGDIDGMDGYDAVRLWRAFERGSENALERLLAYNRADVENMVPLAREVYARLRQRTFRWDGLRPSAPG